MNAVDPTSVLALVAALLLMVTVVFMRKRRDAARRPARRPPAARPAGFSPQAVRVLTHAERQSHQLLSQAMPGSLVLAQVPLTRFLRVQSDPDAWLQQVGALSADLVLCDGGSRVLVVVSVRSTQASEKSRRRHDLMMRLLKHAGVKVLSWKEDQLPDLTMVRQQLFAVLTGTADQAELGEVASRPMPLIPVAEVLSVDSAADAPDSTMEPVASTLFDELAPDLPLPARR